MNAQAPLDLASPSQLVNAFEERWRRGEQPDTLTAVAQHPQLREDRAAYVDLAYTEFMMRQDAGEKLDPDAYCARFPDIQASLRTSLDAARIVGAHPSMLSEPPPRVEAAPKPEAGPTAKEKVPWPMPGTTFGDLKLLRELGEGAFARVYLATEASAGGRPVAVKFSREGPTEAHTLGRLHHEHIVPIHWAEYDEATRFHVVCMPFLGSATLLHVLAHLQTYKGASRKRGTAILEAIQATVWPRDPAPLPASPGSGLAGLSFSDAVEHLAEHLADALAFLHNKGLVHRDLKPSNILLTPEGRPLLLDFNLSKAADVPTRHMAGTFAYMAPEQIQAWADRRSSSFEAESQAELYSLAVILYELLTGQHPLGALPYNLEPAQMHEWVQERQKTDPAPVRALNPAASPRLARLLERCLSREPGKRPAGAAALAAQLRRPRRLRGWLIAASGVALLLLATALPFGLMHLGAGQGGERAHETRVEPQLDPDAAARLSRSKAKQQVNQAWGLLREGKKAEAQKMLKSAVEAYDRAIEANGEWDDYADKGRALMLQDQFKQAEGLFYSARDRFHKIPLPKRAPTANLLFARMVACLSYCLARNHDHERAIRYGKEAVKAGFDSPALQNNIGYSCMQGQDDENPQPYFIRALRGNPDLLPALHNQAVLAGRRGDPPAVMLSQMGRVINEANKHGLDTAELYEEAARMYAYASRKSGGRGKTNDNPLVKRAQAFLVHACNRGGDPDRIRSNYLYKQTLDPTFLDSLPRLEVKNGLKHLPVDVYLVDPLSDALP